ncbi:cytochrome b [Palleronia rufa]|uniref:cytochrome b n=1 Tax=Palleronia rufa TaxID=1530186 RepID=UPI00055AFC91|nr:cytochrome b/b6 domain-containing protein [Palleronia rufa]
MAQRDSYSASQIALHWAIVLAVAATWLASDGMGKLVDQKMQGTLTTTWPLHVILGLTVLTLAAIRLVVRLSRGAPGAKPGTPEPLAKARHWGHVLLYVLLIGTPLGGIAVWFLGIDAVAPWHPIAGNALVILAGLHAALGLYHHYVRKDGTLRRMMTPNP